MYLPTYPPNTRVASLATEILETLWNLEDAHKDLMVQIKTLAMTLEVDKYEDG